MKELWVVRHGETAWTRRGRLTGWTDIPLARRGRAQAQALRPRLEHEIFQGVFSSDLRRAVETARLAYGEPAIDRRLREIHFGELEGAEWDTLAPPYRKALVAFDPFVAPGGESVEMFRRRVVDFVEALPPGRHLLFTHGGVIRCLLREMGEDRFLPPASVVGLDWIRKGLLFVPSTTYPRTKGRGTGA
ncbi:MAG: histidine phosphatase family protein [Bacillota bacterium]